MSYHCRSCKTEVPEDLAKRLPFSAACDRCSNDLHSCLHCIFYDRTAYNECREPQADRVVEKDRRNRCEYFTFAEGLAPVSGQSGEARSKLDSLFGDDKPTAAKSPKDALDDLFKK